MNNCARPWPARRGATEWFDILARSGVPSGTEIVRAVLKKAVNDSEVPPDTAPPVLTFSVQYVAAAGAEKAYWRLSAAAADTAALETGIYVTDAHIEAAGVTYQSEPLFIDFTGRVTA